jgi:hypothetical protein
MPSAVTLVRRRRRRTTKAGRLIGFAGALALVPLAACDDDGPASPPDGSSSENVPGGTALPGDQPSVENENVGNPAAPQDPVGSGP